MGTLFGMLPFALLVLQAYHQPADVDHANSQTGLPFGTALAHAHQEIAVGAYGLTAPTLLWVTLRGACEAIPAVDDWCVAMMIA